MTFLNPLILLGLAAAAIPIVVHLFNFRKPKRVDFSTLRFVREIEATAMRRVRIRQWLLLALRTLALIFLVLAFARPTRTAEASGVFGDDGAQSLALVVDNSRSMLLRDAQGAFLDQALDLSDQILEATGPGDERTIVPMSAPPEYRPVPFTTPGPARDVVAGLAAAPGAEPLTSAVARAASVLEGAVHPRREIVVVSDLQAATFTDSANVSLPEDVEIALVPVGSRQPVNTAVTDVEIVSRIIEPGRPVTVRATVQRFGGDAGTIGASLSLDGQRVSEAAVDLVPGEPATVDFTVTPRQRGWLGGEVRIESDDAEWDDVRYLTIHVPPAPRVLVVRGANARADLVSLALSVSAERGGLVLNEVAEETLPSADLTNTDAVILVGPSALGSGMTSALEAFIAAGGGVLAFAGDDVSSLNGLLSAVGGGRLAEPTGRDDSQGGFADTDLDHPLFVGVFDGANPTPESPDVRRFARYTPGGGDESALIGLAAGGPFLQEIRRGEGSLLLATVAPDLDWSDLPQRGLFVPLLYRSVAYLAAGSASAETGTLSVRDGGQLRVEGADSSEPLRLVAPDGTSLTPIQRTVPGAVVLDVDDAAETAGVYAVMQGDRILRTVAVNEDARESDPTRLDPEEAARQLEARTGRPVRVVDAAAGLAATAKGSGFSLWTVFLALALTCLVAETLLTTRWRKETVT